MLNLRVDPNLPFHYLVGVETKTFRAGKDAGKYRIKYLVKFTNEDVSKVRDSIRLSKDKLFPTRPHEATEVMGCTELVGAISSMFKAVHFNNNVTIHHFSSEFEMKDEDLETFVGTAHLSESTKRKLMESVVKGR